MASEYVECGFSRARELRSGKSRSVSLTVSLTFTVDRPKSFYEPRRKKERKREKTASRSENHEAFEGPFGNL